MRIEDRIRNVVLHLARLIRANKCDEADEFLDTFLSIERTQELVEGRWETQYFTLKKNVNNDLVEINTDGRIYVKNIAGSVQICVSEELGEALKTIHEYLEESLPD